MGMEKTISATRRHRTSSPLPASSSRSCASWRLGDSQAESWFASSSHESLAYYRPYITVNLGRCTTLRGVVQAWGNTHDNVLTLVPPVLLIGLARFAYRHGQARKLRQSIRIAKIVEMPLLNRAAVLPAPGPSTEDEPASQPCRTTQAEYELVGSIIHIGDLAHTGHYHAFTLQASANDNMMELAHAEIMMRDDNIVPQQATPSHVAQITNNAYILAFRKVGSS